MSLSSALKTKPNVYFAVGLLWLIAASAIELGYVGWYVGKWTEALITTSAMYFIIIIYLGWGYYQLVVGTVSRLHQEVKRSAEMLADFFNDHLKVDINEPGMVRQPTPMADDTGQVDHSEDPNYALVSSHENPGTASMKEPRPEMIFIQTSGESVRNDIRWSREINQLPEGFLEFYVPIEDPQSLVVLQPIPGSDSWKYYIYLNFRFIATGRTRKGEYNALLQMANSNPGLTISPELTACLTEIQLIVNRR